MSTPAGKRVALVAAVARNGVIGSTGEGPDIPWRIPGEQARFKEATWGQVLLMGRTTYDTIGRPLPGRTTVVLTRDGGWRPGPAGEGVHVVTSVEAALALADELPGDLTVGGGAQVYAALLPHADEQLLTDVPLDPPGDVRYPEGALEGWIEAARTRHDGPPAYDVVRWVRG